MYLKMSPFYRSICMLAQAIPEMFGENSALSFVLNAVFTKGFLDNIWLIIEAPAFLVMLVTLGQKFEVMRLWNQHSEYKHMLAEKLKAWGFVMGFFLMVLGFLSGFWYSCCVHMRTEVISCVLSHVMLCMLCIYSDFPTLPTKSSLCSSTTSPHS